MLLGLLGNLLRGKKSAIRTSLALSVEPLENRELMASDMVLDWNQKIVDVLKATNTSTGPGWASRNAAMTHLAMYDAVNAIAQTYTSYETSLVAPSAASKEAAVATAAHDVLVALYPSHKTTLDNFYIQSLATIVNGAAEDAGVAVGKQVAQEMLALRANDNSTLNPVYTPGTDPGDWRPDPLNPTQLPITPAWGNVQTFGIEDSDIFGAPPPPTLNSAAYTAAFNEVKALGAKNSLVRTADQTQIAQFWSYDAPSLGTPVVLYNQVTRTIAEQKKNTLIDNARLFALVNMAMADTGITVWDTKYETDLWQPIAAIREAANDGNVNTTADPSWIPLGSPNGGKVPNSTPPLPTYTSAHAGMGEATFRMLRNFYGTDSLSFTLRSDALPGVTRSYRSFSQASAENSRSRVFLGVQFEFDNVNGRAEGRQVADDIFAHYFVKPATNAANIGVQLAGGGFHVETLSGGAADIIVRRQGNDLQVLNNATKNLIFDAPLSRINSSRFNTVNKASDLLTIDATYGGTFSLPGGVHYNSNTGEKDRLWYNDTNLGSDMTLDGSLLNLPSIAVTLTGVTNVGLAGHGGDDSITIKGEQAGRRVDMLGLAGNDSYNIGATNLMFSVDERNGSGNDTLDFTSATASVIADLALNAGQRQSVGAGNGLEILGNVEGLTGSRFADRLRGSAEANIIRGLAGNDMLFGRGGSDELYGDDGDDILLGEDGNDILSGGNGKDILIGGNGSDLLDGNAGENLLIGGTTAHDANDQALLSMLNEWTMAATLQTRIADLTAGTGSVNRRNGTFFLTTTDKTPTVREDNAKDQLFGDASTNWILSGRGDTVKTN